MNDQLHIYQHICKEVKTRRKNIAMAWIDYHKAYDNALTNMDNRQFKNIQDAKEN